jgi:hypothetical protein
MAPHPLTVRLCSARFASSTGSTDKKCLKPDAFVVALQGLVGLHGPAREPTGVKRGACAAAPQRCVSYDDNEPRSTREARKSAGRLTTGRGPESAEDCVRLAWPRSTRIAMHNARQRASLCNAPPCNRPGSTTELCTSGHAPGPIESSPSRLGHSCSRIFSKSSCNRSCAGRRSLQARLQ